MSDDIPKRKSETKNNKIAAKERQKAVRAGGDDQSDEKLFVNEEGGETIFDLGNKRKRVSVGQFKGKANINLREYFEKEGKWLPTKKGITLNTEQWALLKKLMPKIDAALQRVEK